MYMAKLSATGNIDWLHVLPKRQGESTVLGRSVGSYGFAFYSFFDPVDSRPFYAGFSSMASKKTVHIFFNDHEKNADVLQPGKKIKSVDSYGKTSCYQVDLDMMTGKYTRKAIFSNKDIPVSMPRLGSVMNNTMWVTGKEDRLMAKSKIAVGKIVCAD